MSASKRHNLPAPLSSFIGRQKEIAEVQGKLASHRLVTLTGTGGSGKTRLAIEVARRVGEDFGDGLCWVELAALADENLVGQTVAEAIGVREAKNEGLEARLAYYLVDKVFLLLLDNCEHLISACAGLADHLLQNCPDLKILATSREPLGISGETVVIVPPLSLPEPQPWRAPSSVESALPIYQQSEAMQLFSERAGAAASNFELSLENGPWVAEICRRLDGMPLAIELAAARSRSLTIRQIAERLDDRFILLTGGSRTAPPRQQTLAATLDWSYGLLSEKESSVLRALSVFSGGCTLPAAEAVCTNEEVTANEVLDLLTQLADKSLVNVERKNDEIRYSLLETIRQYVHEKLMETGKVDHVRAQHLIYFMKWAENAEPHLQSENQVPWLDKFEAEHDNFRAALDFAIKANRSEEGLRLVSPVGIFWKFRGFPTEGRKRLEAALAQPGAQQPSLARARALRSAYVLAFYQSDYPAVRRLAQESLEIASKLGDQGKQEMADAFEILAEHATETGNHAKAPAYYEKALALYKQIGDLVGMGDALKMMGWSAMRVGDYGKAEPLLNEGLIACRESGDLHQIASGLSGLGELAIRQGQLARAKNYLLESLNISRTLGEKWGPAISLGSLGWVALLQKDFHEMRKLLGESLATRVETEDRGGTAWCLEKLAEGASLLGDSEKAVLLYGAAAGLRATVNSAMDLIDQPDYERVISKLQANLGKEEFAKLWAGGGAMELADVIELGLSDPSARQSAREKYGGLTAREREVAALIAQGKSNREIAKEMTVGVKTVETYVTRMLDKLGFDSRVQIATWMIEKEK